LLAFRGNRKPSCFEQLRRPHHWRNKEGREDAETAIKRRQGMTLPADSFHHFARSSASLPVRERIYHDPRRSCPAQTLSHHHFANIHLGVWGRQPTIKTSARSAPNPVRSLKLGRSPNVILSRRDAGDERQGMQIDRRDLLTALRPAPPPRSCPLPCPPPLPSFPLLFPQRADYHRADAPRRTSSSLLNAVWHLTPALMVVA